MLKRKLSLLLLALVFAACNTTELSQTTSSQPVENVGNEHDHSALIALPDAKAVQAFFKSGTAELTRDEPFEQLSFMLSSGAPPVLEYRTSKGDWQRAEVTWSEAPLYNARIILEGPTKTLELRSQGLGSLQVEFYGEATKTPQMLARDLPFEKALEKGLTPQTAPSSLVVSRYEWGARDPGKVCNNVLTPYRMAIHHTAGTGGKTNPAAVMRQIQAYHIDSNEWCDIGYHFVVSYDGTIFQGRSDETRPGAHVGGQNTGNIGVALMGDFHTAPPPDSQLGGAARIVGWVSQTYGIALNRDKVQGHREWAPGTTSCPGDELLALIPTILTRAGGNAPPPTPCTPSWPLIKQNNDVYAENVKAVQYLLRSRGNDDTLEVDGYFGPATKDAVKRFQDEQKLKPNGVIGKQTWTELVSSVRKDDRGDEVRAVQTLLNIDVDGAFGQRTEEEVQRFQADQNLSQDGVVGPNTWAALVGGKGCP